GHFLAVFAENDSLIDELEKWLGGGDEAEIEQDFVPETGVEEMQHGVFGAADVEIDARRFVAADVRRRIGMRFVRLVTSAATHPIVFRVFGDEGVWIPRVEIA